MYILRYDMYPMLDGNRPIAAPAWACSSCKMRNGGIGYSCTNLRSLHHAGTLQLVQWVEKKWQKTLAHLGKKNGSSWFVPRAVEQPGRHRL